MAANFPGAGNAIPGLMYAVVMTDATEVKAHHDFERTNERTIAGDIIFVCPKCGLRARMGKVGRPREDINKLYIIYPFPIKSREITGDESCAEIIIWDILE